MLTGFALWSFLGVVLLSAVIQSTLGFGFSIFGMIFFPYLFATYPQAAAVSSLLSMLTSLVVAGRLYKKIRWRILLPCAAGYLFTSPIAIRFSMVMEKDVLTRMLGAMLVLLGLYFTFLGNRLRIRPTLVNGLLTGALSGVGGGFFAVGGPPLVIYFLSSLEDKEEYAATVQGCMVLTGIYAAAVRIISGIITVQLAWNMAAGAVVMLFGALLGYAVMKRLRLELLRKAVYVFMILSGAKMLLGF